MWMTTRDLCYKTFALLDVPIVAHGAMTLSIMTISIIINNMRHSA